MRNVNKWGKKNKNGNKTASVILLVILEVNFYQLDLIKKYQGGTAGEIAQWSKALIALPKDQRLIPSTHTVAHSQL